MSTITSDFHLTEPELSPRAGERRGVLVAFILLFFALSWFTLTASFLRLSEPSMALDSWIRQISHASYYLSIVFSSVIGSILAKRMKRRSLLLGWMLAGVVLSFVSAALVDLTEWQLLTVSILLGSAFGVGMPACLALFADLVRLEVRGTTSGAIFLASNLIIAILAIALEGFEPRFLILVAGVWRAIGASLFLFFMPREKLESETKKSVSFVFIRNRRFLLYFIPWLAFCLVDFFENPIRQSLFTEIAPLASVLGLAIGSASAIVGGVVADRIGRKIPILYSFVSIGLAYAVLSFAPHSASVVYFYTVINGIAWGILTSIFILTLWGDLSQFSDREEYYAIGNAPFFLAAIIELAVMPYASFIQEGTAFSLAVFFLFLAILPLIYAPETLPEKRIKEMELKGYLEKAKKLKEKHV